VRLRQSHLDALPQVAREIFVDRMAEYVRTYLGDTRTMCGLPARHAAGYRR
jgi:hypothetical protein